MDTFPGFTTSEAKEFTDRWLPAWTGNDPDLLVSFYSHDATYLDPAIPEGIQGRPALHAYFTTLLAQNPDWTWTHRGSMPLANGFVNLWHAKIPLRDKAIECDGLCTVQIQDGLIYRNEVYFDRATMLTP